MTRTFYVTSVQVEAARMLVERSARQGKPVSETIRMIAEAKPEPRPGEAGAVASRPVRRKPPAKSRKRGWIGP
jgi:Flp pilus assembly protein TadB